MEGAMISRGATSSGLHAGKIYKQQEATADESCIAYHDHRSTCPDPYLNSVASSQLSAQQQGSLLQPGSTDSAASGAASDPTVLLYAEWKGSHAQEHKGASRLAHASHMTSVVAPAVAQQHNDLVAAERALRARQQQQHLQQQQLAARMQLYQQQQQQAGASAPAYASAGGRSGSSSSTVLYGTHHGCNSTFSQYPSSVGDNHLQTGNCRQHTSCLHHQHLARLPPRPAPASSHHYHPYSHAAAGGLVLNHHHASGADGIGHGYATCAGGSVLRAPAAASAPAAMPATFRHPGSAVSSASSAAPRGSLGPWSGAVAVLEHNHRLETGNAAGDLGSLECDEELFSMECCDAVPQHVLLGASRADAAGAAAAAAAGHGQQQQPLPNRLHGPLAAAAGYGVAMHYDDTDQAFDLYEDSGSTHPDSEGEDANNDMDADGDQQQHYQHHGQHLSGMDTPALVAARGAAVASEQAAASRQSVAHQVLGQVATLRKGGEVLTAHPAVAEALGVQSVRSRLLITEVSVYSERATNSLMALDQCNRLLSKMKLPGGINYMPVQPDSFLFKAGSAWQFPAFVLCLGSSYMQRMLTKLPQLSEAAMMCPGFEDYCAYVDPPPRQVRKLAGDEAVSTLATLHSIQFTCIFLATKVADQVHALSLLRFILTNLSHNGVVVSQQQASDVEARCLDALDWRLGPFFIEDDLSDDDQEMWAAAMGHWDYGTSSDPSPGGF